MKLGETIGSSLGPVQILKEWSSRAENPIPILCHILNTGPMKICDN